MSLLQLLRIDPYANVISNYWEDIANDFWLVVSKGNFDEAEKMIKANHFVNRQRIIGGFSEKEDSLELSVAWTSARPTSAYANVFFGASLIQAGWRFRGTAYAEKVGKEDYDQFLEYQVDSLGPLMKAAELDPSLVEPFTWMLSAGMGIGNSAEENAKLFSEAIARDKFNFEAYYSYFLPLTEKWGGSNNEMFKFVRESSQQAPRGSSIHILIPLAYAELILIKRSELITVEAKKVFNNNIYKKELVDALYAWLDCTNNNLEEALSLNKNEQIEYGLNYFGAILYFCGAINEARAVVKELKGQISLLPWHWISQSAKEKNKVGFVYDRVCRELNIPVFKNIVKKIDQ